MAADVFDPIEDAIEEIQRGRMVIVVDDADRENEGDLIMAAATVTPEAIAFMVRHTSGVICMPMSATASTRSDPAHGAATSPTPSAPPSPSRWTPAGGPRRASRRADRARTIRAMVDPDTGPDDLVRPGHVFPLRYLQGGVLKRAGHTEAAVDLAVLAGLYPAGVLCEIVNEDGTMARLPALASSRGSTTSS